MYLKVVLYHLSYGCITCLVPNCLITFRVLFTDSSPNPHLLAIISLGSPYVSPDDDIVIVELSLDNFVEHADLSRHPEISSPFWSSIYIFTE